MSNVDFPRVDVAGVGFGPSNLALAIAFSEPSEHTAAMFFERQQSFGWHRGMLLDDSRMQISFLKDLVTLRNPHSPYSFVSYLHQIGRLPQFINCQTFFPLRRDFHKYLEWAASCFSHQVLYGAPVTRIRPIFRNGSVRALEILVRQAGGGESVACIARNVVISTGLIPRMPEGITETERIWHNAHLVDNAEKLDSSESLKFVVVGAGQSAAETVRFLYQKFPRSRICAVFSRYGYSVADDSPFANAIFDSDATDTFYVAPSAVRQKLLDYHAGTNYSAVDLDLSRELYDIMYQESLTGQSRIRILNLTRLLKATERDNAVHIFIKNLSTSLATSLRADYVICATGYYPSDPLPLFDEELAGRCGRDPSGRLQLNREYQVATSDQIECGLYVTGPFAEQSHGIGAGLLSNVATRAGEIRDAIRVNQENYRACP
ncbi:SidA/IucD/PvdA family monooxygenase [Streptomyces sp. NPDC093982]|uniref:lysine N(6)-hydroxylase/L-ornithine N(5)-oxygenase family protein n=1 Tax=Streptomyces sp. NPDC093982 TaxID=3155077 RepID=UPI003445558A